MVHYSEIHKIDWKFQVSREILMHLHFHLQCRRLMHFCHITAHLIITSDVIFNSNATYLYSVF